MRPSHALVLAALALLPPTARAQAAGDPARVQALYSEARYGEALEEARLLEDPVLAAEWRTYLFLAGGDYPAALRAAQEGLEAAPGHRGLLVNAIHVALTLGLAEEAARRVETLELALQEQGATPEELERAERLGASAGDQRALERRGRTSLVRARVVVAVAALAVLAAMLALGLRPVRR